MCVSVTALSSQMPLLPRGVIFFGRKNLSRVCQEKLCCTGNVAVHCRAKNSSVTVSETVRNFCSSRQQFLPWLGGKNSSDSSSSSSPTLTKQQAKELADKLTAKEREVLASALEESKSQEDKASFEDQLAAIRWRSKFGRPSKVPTLGDVDPTGSYCPVPDDWLLRKYAENVPEPSTKNLVLVAIANAIPFIGFGFLDNFIMIVAGDQIEMILNRKFPISTMTAAALGNTVSDVIGIGSVHYVEMFAQKIGIEQPTLTPIQLSLPKTRFAANVGRVLGVTIGCLIGMTPIPLFALFHTDS